MQMIEDIINDHPNCDKNKVNAVQDCISACLTCVSVCQICADACLSEENNKDLVTCIKNNLLCSDTSLATAKALSSSAHTQGAIRSLLESCQAICKVCGDECEKHAQKMHHCRVCADCCRECEKSCASVLEA